MGSEPVTRRTTRIEQSHVEEEPAYEDEYGNDSKFGPTNEESHRDEDDGPPICTGEDGKKYVRLILEGEEFMMPVVSYDEIEFHEEI